MPLRRIRQGNSYGITVNTARRRGIIHSLSTSTRSQIAFFQSNEHRSTTFSGLRCLTSTSLRTASYATPESLPPEDLLLQRYHKLVQEKDVQTDPHQLYALEALERLRKDLLETEPSHSLPSLTNSETKPSLLATGGFLSSWLGGANATPSTNKHMHKAQKAIQQAMTGIPHPRGVYLHGGVGCGKTFLMNLFYDSIVEGPWAEHKQKIHFHKFMLRIHQDMHASRYDALGKATQQADLILPSVVAKTLEKGRLLCLDEFQVTDVADALILQRLFTGLWQHGCVVVATSNRPPDGLYWNGIQRDRFLPFIDLLKLENDVVTMDDSGTDYRLVQKAESGATTQVSFVGKTGKMELDGLFYQLTAGSPVTPTSLQTQGRKVKIPQAALKKGIARFSFEDLCQKALGAADYLIIGKHFHTVFVDRIPVLTLNELNWVRRFITFVDSMYESDVKLILHGKTIPSEIFQKPSHEDNSHDEVFAFDRTVSRLEEMASRKYLTKRWAGCKQSESMASILSSSKAKVDFAPS